jgi:hypothetical protein
VVDGDRVQDDVEAPRPGDHRVSVRLDLRLVERVDDARVRGAPRR